MGSGKRSSKGKAVSRASSSIKGHLVEQVVAKMYEWRDVEKVETRVHLPTRGNPKRTREIDVLLTMSPAGHTIQMPIECKNERKPIGAPQIDAFIGKLGDIDFPAQLGIYVSASGYTQDAIERAQEAGVTPLTLSGLTEDRLSSTVFAAFQSLVFAILEVESITISNDSSTNQAEAFSLYNEDDDFVGYLQDLIWQKWVEGEPSSIIGQYDLQIEVPESWHRIVAGKSEPIRTFEARVQVLGAVITIAGEAQAHALINAVDNTLGKQHVSALFPPVPSGSVTVFGTEAELNVYLENQGALHVTIGRFRLPRISWGHLYWPPSKRVTRKLMGIMQAYASGEISTLPQLERAEVEGTDLSALWEPIWEAYPAYIRQRLMDMNGGYDPAEQDPAGWTPFFRIYHTIATCHACGTDTPQSLLAGLTKLPASQIQAILCRPDGKGSSALAGGYLKGTCAGTWSTEGEQFAYRVIRYVRGVLESPLEHFKKSLERLAALLDKEGTRADAAHLASRLFWRCADAPILIFWPDKPSIAPITLPPVDENFVITDAPPTVEHRAFASALDEPRMASVLSRLRAAATPGDLSQYYLPAFIRLSRWQDALDTAAAALARPDLDSPRRAGVLARQGIVYEQMHCHAEALAAFSEALELVPGHPELLMNRGRVHANMENYTGALSDYNAALADYPDYPDALRERGYANDLMGSYTQALADYDRSLELEPDDPVALVRRGLTYAHLGQLEKALENYDAALDVYPEYAVALSNKGIALYQLERHEESLENLNRSLESNPDDATTLSARGNTFNALGRHTEALADFTESLRRSPDDPGTLHNRAVTHTMLDQYQEALADYERSLEVRPSHAHTLAFRGLAYDRLDRYQEALADLNLALELMTSQQAQSKDPLLIAAVYSYRGLTLYHLGRYDEAIPGLTRSFDAGFDAAAALGNRALAYLRLHRTSEAEADLARLEELFPEEAGTFYNKACFYCLRGNHEESLAALTAAIQGYPKYGALAATDTDFDGLHSDSRFRRLVGLATD